MTMTKMVKLKRFLALIVVLSMTACATAPAPEPVPAIPSTIQTPEPVISQKPAEPSRPVAQKPVEPPIQAVQKPPSTKLSKPVTNAQAPKVTPEPKPVSKPVAPPKPVADQPTVVVADIPGVTAPVQEQEPEIRKVEAKPLSLSLLPMRFGKNWTLDRRPNPVTKTTECLLISDPVTIADGYDMTSVQLLLTTGMLYVKTGSNIDLSYPQSGMQIDNGPLWAFDSVIKETSVTLGAHYEEVVSRFGYGKTVTAHLGFWPTWPMTETREASFSLEGIESSIARLTECENM